VAQIKQESGFNPCAQSPVGAGGIAQIMPATAKAWHVNRWEPEAALNAAAYNMARYIRTYKRMGYSQGKAERYALWAYNAGPDNTKRYIRKQKACRESTNYAITILRDKLREFTG
jgi:soluble lytic murein transglycosylase-like protein